MESSPDAHFHSQKTTLAQASDASPASTVAKPKLPQAVSSALSLEESVNREPVCERCSAILSKQTDSLRYVSIDKRQFVCASCYYLDCNELIEYHEQLAMFDEYWTSGE